MIFAAFSAVEAHVREHSGLDLDEGRLMTDAFEGDPPPIFPGTEPGEWGVKEHHGMSCCSSGRTRGIRNPKAHRFVDQTDPQRPLEYLGFASLFLRRLDDAAEHGP